MNNLFLHIGFCLDELKLTSYEIKEWKKMSPVSSEGNYEALSYSYRYFQ